MVVTEHPVAIELRHSAEIVERAGAVMQLAIGEAALQVRVGVLGIDPDRHVVVGNGAVRVAGDPIRLGPALERRSIAGIEPDRLTEIADRAIGVALFEIGETASQIVARLLRLELDGPVEVGERRID